MRNWPQEQEAIRVGMGGLPRVCWDVGGLPHTERSWRCVVDPGLRGDDVCGEAPAQNPLYRHPGVGRDPRKYPHVGRRLEA